MAGKRGKGEGSVYQRPDKKWRGQVMIDGRRHNVLGDTRREVQAKLRQLAADAARGVLPPSEQVTLAVLLDRWLDTVARHSVRPRTLKNYRDLTRLYILPALGARRVTHLQPAEVQALYSALIDRGLSPKTVRNVHVALRRGLRQGVDWDLVPRNVATMVDVPHLAREEVAALSEAQSRLLLDTARDTIWGGLLVTALATGMRMGEVIGLRWSDVDLDRASLRVQRQRGQDGVFSEPKSPKARRTIDLPAACVRVLREHKRAQNARRLARGPDWHDGDLVFCTREGQPLLQSNVLRAFKAALARAGLPAVAFHALRHTHATLLLARGIHPKIVQERLGHATIAMTLDTYSAYIPSMGRDAADKLDDLLA